MESAIVPTNFVSVVVNTMVVKLRLTDDGLQAHGDGEQQDLQMIRRRVRTVRGPQCVKGKEQQEPGFTGDQDVEHLFVGAAATLQHPQGAAQREADQRHDRTHGRLRIALRDIVRKQRKIAGHRRCEHAAQSGEADDVHRTRRKCGEQEHRFFIGNLDVVRHDPSALRVMLASCGPRGSGI
jgi:hypothetical protein